MRKIGKRHTWSSARITITGALATGAADRP